MYSVSLIQPNFAQGNKSNKAYWLPHSIASVYCYTALDPDYADHFQLNQIIWRRSEITQTALACAGDDLVLFSNYMWNWEYNKTLAQSIKTLNPRVKIIFGGPQCSEWRLSCLLYTSPSPRDQRGSRMPSSA